MVSSMYKNKVFLGHKGRSEVYDWKKKCEEKVTLKDMKDKKTSWRQEAVQKYQAHSEDQVLLVLPMLVL